MKRTAWSRFSVLMCRSRPLSVTLCDLPSLIPIPIRALGDLDAAHGFMVFHRKSCSERSMTSFKILLESYIARTCLTWPDEHEFRRYRDSIYCPWDRRATLIDLAVAVFSQVVITGQRSVDKWCILQVFINSIEQQGDRMDHALDDIGHWLGSRQRSCR